MNKLTKITALLLIITSMFISVPRVYAQQDDKMERFREEKIAFFNEHLALTDAEADAFWPVYEDLHNRRTKLMEDERNLLNYISCNSEFMSEQETDETIKKYITIQENRLALDKQFHNKFVEIIGKKKTMQMYSVEREFRIFLLKKFRGGEGHGPGQGQRGGGRQYP